MKPIRNYQNYINLLIFFSSLICCGLISLWLGKDLGWDIANYHFFNPYSFIHHRYTQDYWPPSYPHAFFSPTADFICYFLVRYFSSTQTVFITGAIHGLNLWLLFLVAKEFLPKHQFTLLFAFLIGLLGMYGPIGFHGIGDFNVDHLSSIFVLSFVFFQVRFFKEYENQNHFSLKNILLANLFLGIAIGLKLTAGLFGVGAALSFAFLLRVPLIDRFKILILAGSAILTGILVSSGYWMIIMWNQFHNPFYPFFDNIFNPGGISPPELREGYTSIMPHGFFKTLFYPFYFSFFGTGEGSFQDFRFLFAYALLIIFVISRLFKKIKYPKINLISAWFILFFIFSYVIGQSYFASLRYMLPLEMLAPLLIYILVSLIFTKQILRFSISFGILYIIALTMYPRNFPLRVPHYTKDYLSITIPESVKKTHDAMVLLVFSAYALEYQPRPAAYVIPYLPSQWKFVGLGCLKGKFDFSTNQADHIRELIKNHQHSFYVLTGAYNISAIYTMAHKLGLRESGPCSKIYSERQSFTGNVYICPLEKISIFAKKSA